MSKRILLVEDDNTTSVLIQKYIKDMGYTTASAVSSGEEAYREVCEKYREVCEKQPDIVLMDITLEGEMDGIDSAKKISNEYDIPIIYITCSTDKATLDRIKFSNPFGYIIKPINKKELKATIEMASLRYNMEKRLRENEQKLSTILNSIADGVIVADSFGKVSYINPVAEDMIEYRIDENEPKKLNDIIHIENAAIQSLKEHSAINISSIQGYNYLVTKGGKKIPIDYSVAPQKNEHGKFIGTVMVIRDVTERVNSEEKVLESITMLRKAMGGMIQAIASTIETRDPYTAGHQRRVSDLAREIARSLGLSQGKIEGIRMAGVIHDLGKISVPAEILSKPGKLTEIEFNLIKIHPNIGYEIIKPIDFPWPVADIIYQHHERINGTGYPRGLSGGDILIEAKIMTVADVVEAMASHRPYRAALGIEIALDEILKNKGIFYDTDVVDACMDLFRVKGYKMTGFN